MALAPKYARTAAKEAWGNVNSCKQVVPGVYAVDTWGHGGYIVAVGPDEPFDLAPELRIERFKGASWTRAGEPILTFYQFEEDCDWAVLLHYHPELLAASIRKNYLTEATTEADVLRCVKSWNPTMVRA